jgi:carbamoyl-phosphate synthase large subunit
MRERTINKTLVIGSGPIVIGQAAEFDYSGTQACETLKKEGIEVVLVNSNPATIMTDKAIADRIYIEPITAEYLEKVIAKERPDSILIGMGGQTALNMGVELNDKGILEKYGVKVIGTPVDAIKKGEDRELFRKAMTNIGEPIIESRIVESLEEGFATALEIGYPVVVRPAYTLGGTGGGIARDSQELEEILLKGLKLSRVGQVLIEKSILGWKEIEYEVIRDKTGKCITICDMENVDPVGIHTGDSIVVAPTQSISVADERMLRKSALKIIDEIGVIGGCNVQFALHPTSSEYAIIEINPRVSRSSALASKATGYPIARVSTKLAMGYSLAEIGDGEPRVDYTVVKIPKWPFDKFKQANRKLGTKMMATGEVMAIGDSFEVAFLKGIRSLEIGRFNLEHPAVKRMSLEELREEVSRPDDERIFVVAEMLRRGCERKEIQRLTGIDRYFVEKLEWIVKGEKEIKQLTLEDLSETLLRTLKEKGYADKGIAELMGVTEDEIRGKRDEFKIHPVYKCVEIHDRDFKEDSSYFYSTYESVKDVETEDKRKIIVIGSGPIRIGQGIEFDYCTVHSIKTLKKMGIESIIINNNPETVSTDFLTADRLYFEPLVTEDVMEIIEKEKPEGVILQFGGQTAIKLAEELSRRGIKILGTSAEKIDEAEDREKFDTMMEKLGIKRPKGKAVWNVELGCKIANEIGYPVLVRPSYVLGGQGMEICHEEQNLIKYLESSFARDPENPVLIDKYLNGIEIEVDAICDGDEVLIPGVMEHLERAGIHSGDSITIYPSQNLYENTEEKILEITKKMAKELEVKGLMNIQFIAYENELYVIEVNPRSSRTVPYISKISGVPMIDLATKVILGAKLKELGYGVGIYKKPEVIAVKVPVFSTEKLSGVEVSLGPEMKSTGEVLGVGKNMEEAIYKGLLGGGRVNSIRERKVLVTIRDKDKEEFLPMAKNIIDLGCKIFATEGTQRFLKENGIETTKIKKLGETGPNILDILKNREVDLLVNTPTKVNDSQRDGFKMRRTAIEYGVEVLTSLDTLNAIIDMQLKHVDEKDLEVFDISRI